MSLVDYLNIRSPLLWVVTDEPRRVINDVIANVQDRRVYRMDLMDGFVQYDVERQTWLKVIIDLGDGEEGPTSDLQQGLFYVFKERGVMLLDHAHLSAEALMNFYSYIARTYVDAFMEDNLDKVPATFVMSSCKDEIPPELMRDTVKIHYGLPTEEEVKNIFAHVASKTDTTISPDELTTLVRAGLGMSEMELAQTSKLSIDNHGGLNSEFINKTKLDKLKSDGVLEIKIPRIKIEDIGGLDRMKELIQRVAWTWNHAEESRSFGVQPLKSILLVGVSGTGKSALCEATASALSLDLAKFGAGQAMSKWVGESEANKRRAFAQIKAMKPLVLWIDEFGRDMSGGQSSGSVDGGTTDRVHGEFLTGLQELPDEVFLVCAANRIEELPPEMTRAGRFDKIMFVGFPTLQERVEIFRIHLGEQHKTYDLATLASATPMFTGAEIQQLIKEVRFQIVGDHHRAPRTEDIAAYAPTMKGRIWTNHQEPTKALYMRAKEEWAWASSAQEAEADQVINSGTTMRSTQHDRGKIDNMFSGAVRK